MSQVRKFEPGGKSPTLVYRGNDQIDLDAFANAVQKELELALMQIDDKDGPAVRNYVSQLLQGMYDNKVTYNMAGGWTNDLGLSYNPMQKDGDRNLGIASGILGRTFRNRTAYVKPEDTSAPKYSGPSDISKLILKNIIGPSGNIQYFIEQDGLNKDTGRRDIIERTKLLKKEFERYSNPESWKNTGASQEQINEWINLWNENKHIFDNDEDGNPRITPNEYLALSRLFDGNVPLEYMFYTGDRLNQESPADTRIASDSPNYVTKESWYETTHPRTSSSLGSMTLSYGDKYLFKDRQLLDTVLQDLKPDQLRNLVLFGVQDKNLNMAQPIYDAFTKAYGTTSVFENQYIIHRALEILRENNELTQFDTNANLYYIPVTTDKMDSKGTGLVYKINANGSPTLIEMDRNDIPYFTSQWDKDYFAVYKPAMRSGGIIRKYDIGGDIKRGILKEDSGRNNIWFTGDWSGYNNWHAKNIILPWLQAYQDAGNADWEDIIKKGLDSWNNAGGFDWYYATPEQRKHGLQSDTTKAHQQYIIDNLPGLNTEIARNASFYGFPDKPNSDDRFVDGKVIGTDTDFGIQTGNRRPSIHIGTEGQELTDWQNFYKSLGYTGMYKYLDHWVPTKQANVEGYLAFDPTEQSDTPKSNPELPQGETPQETPDPVKIKYPWLVDEENLPPLPEVDAPNPWLGSLAPAIVGAGRLWDSLHTNSRAWKVKDRSLRPVLEWTYNTYSPITGANGEMYAGFNRANHIRDIAHRPISTDASLVSDQILRGEEQAMAEEEKARLIYNQEIKRTQGEALKRVEDSQARRWTSAIKNLYNIADYRERRSDLLATKYKKDWESRDNYFAEVQKRLQTLADERNEKLNTFYEGYYGDDANRWYDQVMSLANEDLNAWAKANEGKPLSEWEHYNEYVKFKSMAEMMKNDRLRRNISNLYGIGYKGIWSPNKYNQLRWHR